MENKGREILNQYCTVATLSSEEQEIAEELKRVLLKQDFISEVPIKVDLDFISDVEDYFCYGQLLYGPKSSESQQDSQLLFYTLLFGVWGRKLICFQDRVSCDDFFDDISSNAFDIVNSDVSKPEISNCLNEFIVNKHCQKILEKFQSESIQKLSNLGKILIQEESKMPKIRSNNVMRWAIWPEMSFIQCPCDAAINKLIASLGSKSLDALQLGDELKSAGVQSHEITENLSITINLCGWQENSLPLSEDTESFVDLSIVTSFKYNRDTNTIIGLPSYPEILHINRELGDYECIENRLKLDDPVVKKFDISDLEIRAAIDSWKDLTMELIKSVTDKAFNFSE